jgi:hypothetical protein
VKKDEVKKMTPEDKKQLEAYLKGAAEILGVPHIWYD